MARPRRNDPDLVRRAQEVAVTASSVDTLRRCQAVLLPALLGATLGQTAAALGVGRATVARFQVGFRKAARVPAPAAGNWGGRRRALLTPDEEKQFLAPWVGLARAGAMVVVSPIRAALSQRLGQPVKPSVVYRLLARHGWRKVAPDTRHPKSRPEVQEDWKKNSRKCWQPC